MDGLKDVNVKIHYNNNYYYWMDIIRSGFRNCERESFENNPFLSINLRHRRRLLFGNNRKQLIL